MAMSDSEPAPKNPATRPTHALRAPTRSTRASAPTEIAAEMGRDAFLRRRPETNSCPLFSPVSRLRLEKAESERSDHQMHRTDTITPPRAPVASDAGSTCSLNAVVPTASTHQVRKPNIINAPYATAPVIPSSPPAIESTTPSPTNNRRIAI